MALLTSCSLHYFLIFVAVVISSVFVFYLHRFRYWKKRNVKHTNPRGPLGDLSGIGRKISIGEIMKNIYMENINEKVVGFWMIATPALMVNDLSLIKNVLVKDFSHFHDRGFEVDTELEPLADHLFTMNGQKWRNLRIKLAPVFTSGKIKMMYPTMLDVGSDLKKTMDELVKKDETVEVKDLMSRFTLDIVASVVFGLDVSSLKNPDTEFRKMAKALNDRSFLDIVKGWLTFIVPKLIHILKIHALPQNVAHFFMNVVKDTFEYREKNNYKRNDFMQLLIQLKNKGYIEDADAEADSKEVQTFDFTVECAAAQAFLFLFAGFETSAATVQFALYELAMNPELQKKLQNEIDSVISKHNGEFTYDALQGMELLDRIVSETLRKYPVAAFLLRECTKKYTIPDTDIVIEKGTRIIIPVMGIHYNKEIYPNPERFDPDRFLPEEKEKRDRYAYMPFGEGPRICIGNRFGLVQTKIGLVMALRNFNVVVCQKTPIPLVFDPAVDLLSAKGGMHLKFEKRT